MLLTALAVLGAIGSLVGIWAFIDARRNKRIKLLAWESTRARSLALASQEERGYKLSILYERAGQEAEIIEGAFATYVRFANFGREPIRRADIANANPLRINVTMDKGEVLDISQAASSREVIRLSVHDVVKSEKSGRAAIQFDFLDYHDGGVVRILSTRRPKSVTMTGDIIGMPVGLTRSDVPLARGPWGKIGFTLWLLAEVAGAIAIALLFRHLIGSWKYVWLLALPPTVGIGVGILAMLISDSIWPTSRTKRKFPGALALPRPHLRMMESRLLVYPDDLAWDLEERAVAGESDSSEALTAAEDSAHS